MKMLFVSAVAALACACGSVGAHDTYKDVSAPNTEGEVISLKSVVENPANKYTLLDFWASWCGPCMGEVTHLKKTYDAFHDKGFEIYGYSLDQDEETWKSAVEDADMNWILVRAKDASQNTAPDLYEVQYIPTNFLIDSKGKIVATDLRGDALYLTVSQLLSE